MVLRDLRAGRQLVSAGRWRPRGCPLGVAPDRRHQQPPPPTTFLKLHRTSLTADLAIGHSGMKRRSAANQAAGTCRSRRSPTGRFGGLVQVVDLALVLGHAAGYALTDRGGDDTLGLDDLVGSYDAALELLVDL
jgi:hypothetical protein